MASTARRRGGQAAARGAAGRRDRPFAGCSARRCRAAADHVRSGRIAALPARSLVAYLELCRQLALLDGVKARCPGNVSCSWRIIALRTGSGTRLPCGAGRHAETCRIPAVRRATTCSRGSPTGRGGLLSWRKKKPGCSITTTLARSTSCSASSTRARVSRPRRSSRSGSAWRRCGSRSRRSSARASRRRPGTSRSPRVRRRCLSFRCVRRCSSATTTSAPSTSCSA